MRGLPNSATRIPVEWKDVGPWGRAGREGTRLNLTESRHVLPVILFCERRRAPAEGHRAGSSFVGE